MFPQNRWQTEKERMKKKGVQKRLEENDRTDPPRFLLHHVTRGHCFISSSPSEAGINPLIKWWRLAGAQSPPDAGAHDADK